MMRDKVIVMIQTSNLPTIVLAVALFIFSIIVLRIGVIVPRTRSGKRLQFPLSLREKRRIVISVVLMLVSVLLFASVTLVSFESRPAFWAFYMLTILVLLLGIIILAVFDTLETMRDTLLTMNATRRDVRQQIQDLERELHRVTLVNGSRNGKGLHSKHED